MSSRLYVDWWTSTWDSRLQWQLPAFLKWVELSQSRDTERLDVLGRLRVALVEQWELVFNGKRTVGENLPFERGSPRTTHTHTHIHGRWVTWTQALGEWIRIHEFNILLNTCTYDRLRTCSRKNSRNQSESSPLSLSVAVNHNISPHLSLSTPRAQSIPESFAFITRGEMPRSPAVCLALTSLWSDQDLHHIHITHSTFRTNEMRLNTSSSLHPLHEVRLTIYKPAFALKE